MLIGINKCEYHPHFFIFPFRCDKCGNTFVFEHGLRRYLGGWSWVDRLEVPEKAMDRYCDICGIEVLEKKRKLEEER